MQSGWWSWIFDKTTFFKTDLISPFLWSGLNKCSGSRNLLVFRSKLIQFLLENGKHLNWNSIIFKKSNIIMVLILILLMTDPSAFFFVHRELLLLDRLQLVSEVELCSLILSRINLCERLRNREIINIELREIEKRRTRGEHKDEHWTMNKEMLWGSKKRSHTFFWSLANLFSYLETFFSVGLMLKFWRHFNENSDESYFAAFSRISSFTYNFPRRSLTAMFSSLIWTKLF